MRLVHTDNKDCTVTVYHEVGSWYIITVPGGDETGTYRPQRLVRRCSVEEKVIVYYELGISLLAPAVMRLAHTDNKDWFADAVLNRRSPFIMR